MGRMKEYYHEEINQGAKDHEYEYEYDEYQKKEKEKDYLVNNNMALATHIAKQYNGDILELDDLIQEARYGLIKAAEVYDKDKDGVPFSFVAGSYIKKYIRQAIGDYSTMIKMPINYMYQFKKVEDKRDAYFKKNGYYNDENVRAQLKFRNSTFLNIVHGMYAYNSDDDAYVFQCTDDVAEKKENEKRYLTVKRMIQENLTDKQYEVYILCYEMDMTLKDISKLLGISLSQVNSVLRQATDRVDSISKDILSKIKSHS